MATGLPTAQMPDGVRALPTPYDSPDVTPDQMGAGSARALGGLAQTVGSTAVDLYREAKQKADTSQVIGAMGQARAVLNDVVLDPEKGYAALKGSDAIEQRQKYQELVEKGFAAAAGTLTNDDQRRAFAQHLLTIREEAQRHIITHEAKQQELVATAQYQGAEDETIRTLANVALNPVERAKNMADLQRIARAEAVRRYGKAALAPDSPEANAVMVPALQKAATTVMTTALNSGSMLDVTKAYADVAQYLGPHRGAVEKAIGSMQADDVAAREGSKLLTAAVDPKTGWVDPDKAQKALQALPESPAKGDIETYVLKRIGNTEKFRNEQTSQRVGLVFQQGADAQGHLDLSKVSPAVKGWMQQNAPEKWAELKARAAKDAKREADEETPEEYLAWLQLQLDRATKSDELAGMQPAEFEAKWKARLAPKRLTAAAELFAAAQKPDALNVEKIVKEQGVGNGLPAGDSSKWPPDKQRMYGFLTDQVREYRRQNPQAKEADLRKFTDDWLIKVNVNDTGLVARDTVPRAAAAALPKYQGKTVEPVGPDSNEKQLIIDAYKARNNGREPTQAEILQRYRRFHGLPETP